MGGIKNKLKRTSLDFFYNIVASAILTGVMQVIVYPLLSRWVSLAEYGTIVTAMGLVNTIVGGLGTSLNNTRLIMNSEYNKQRVKGDFNLCMVVLACVSAVLLFGIGFVYLHYSLLISTVLGFTSAAMIFRQYMVVEYRIILNFKKIMICNIFGALGYIIGVGFFYAGLKVWPMIFLCSEIISLIYILKSTDIWKEPFSTTILFSVMSKKVLILLVSVLFANMLTYFDRIFLYPTLGSETVSIYTVASFFGKSLAIVMTPISGVLLGYFAQDGYQFNKKKFLGFDGLIVVVSVIFAIVALLVSPFFTKFLYPSIFDEAKNYIFIANTAAIIAVSCNMLQTVILKFSPTYYQILKEGLYAVIYFVLSFLMLLRWGLLGFCYAALIANILKYIIVSFMGIITFREKVN